MLKTSNVIELDSCWGKVGMKYYINPCKDPKTGRYPDCVRKVDSNGDMILSEKDKNEGVICIPEDKVYVIMAGTTFNLDDPYEAADWEAIKHCKLIAKSRDERDAHGNLIIDGPDNLHTKNYEAAFNARNGIAELFVKTPGIESERKVNRKKLKNQAETFIFDDSMEGLILKARLLGKKMTNVPLVDIQDYLLEEADRNPMKIINLYSGNDTHLRLLRLDAIDKRVIVVKDKMHYYGDGIVLGASEDAVIQWMKNPKNIKILDLIKKETHPELYDDDEDSVTSTIEKQSKRQK